MKNIERILQYINVNGIDGVANSDVVRGTKIKPHQQVFSITRRLRETGQVHGKKIGKEWFFYPKKVS